MSWLTNYVLPKIRALTRKDVPDNLWRKCPSCEQMLFHRDLAQSLDVCHHCGHHFRIGSEARFKILFDDGAFEKIEAPKVGGWAEWRMRVAWLSCTQTPGIVGRV